MELASIRAILLASAASLALSGCEKALDGAGPTGDAPVARAATSVRLVDRDIEAPQVFQVTDAALWDGRPSLGGVWVASPDAVDPERVILRNPSNGKFVIGALFRRERLNPGPTLQISSDAAAALGILAGQPSKINVTALRREEAEPAPAPDATKPILDANEAVATTELAAAAIDRADEPTAAQPAVATAPAAKGAAPSAKGAVVDTTALAAAEPATEAEPKRKKGWLFGKRKAAAEAALPAEGAITTAALPAGAAIETSALPGAKGAAKPIPVAAVAAPKPAIPQPAAARPAGKAALIQIGIFSVDANADRAVKLLKAKGVAARKLTETSQGKTFWRVVADAPDRTAALASVKAAGFADAYPVSR